MRVTYRDWWRMLSNFWLADFTLRERALVCGCGDRSLALPAGWGPSVRVPDLCHQCAGNREPPGRQGVSRTGSARWA
jgi:hypothetical protein